jgi:alcohol/geraniol dehydrogenase (NADP+)
MSTAAAFVVAAAREPFVRQDVDLGPLGDEDVEIAVEYCGLCHSDLSVLNNDWHLSSFPAVLGHEAIGRIVALGSHTKGLAVGQRVGVGWNSGSCMHCSQCIGGEHNLCSQAEATIINHRGGFASRLRAHWAWTLPIPDTLPSSETGPLLCGGITVFTPLALFARPTSRVGIVGIGGLGHIAVMFAAAMGCEVTAFTSSERKFDEARGFGAHHVVSSRDSAAIKKQAGQFDMLVSTVNVPLDWDAFIAALAPHGRLHVVGAVLERIPVEAMSLIFGLKSISGSPVGSPSRMAEMLYFAARHGVTPQTEHFPMSKINDAFAHLRAGKANYRIVLDADF